MAGTNEECNFDVGDKKVEAGSDDMEGIGDLESILFWENEQVGDKMDLKANNDDFLSIMPDQEMYKDNATGNGEGMAIDSLPMRTTCGAKINSRGSNDNGLVQVNANRFLQQSDSDGITSQSSRFNVPQGNNFPIKYGQTSFLNAHNIFPTAGGVSSLQKEKNPISLSPNDGSRPVPDAQSQERNEIQSFSFAPPFNFSQTQSQLMLQHDLKQKSTPPKPLLSPTAVNNSVQAPFFFSSNNQQQQRNFITLQDHAHSSGLGQQNSSSGTAHSESFNDTATPTFLPQFGQDASSIEQTKILLEDLDRQIQTLKSQQRETISTPAQETRKEMNNTVKSMPISLNLSHISSRNLQQQANMEGMKIQPIVNNNVTSTSLTIDKRPSVECATTPFFTDAKPSNTVSDQLTTKIQNKSNAANNRNDLTSESKTNSSGDVAPSSPQKKDGKDTKTLLSNRKLSSSSDKEISSSQKAKDHRDRNREHARNTRLRKKAYLEKLKATVEALCRERDNLINEREAAAKLLLESHNARTNVLLSFFVLRSRNESRRELWSKILEESCFTCTMPVTPYRSFLANEVQISQSQRTILGIDGIMRDTCSFHVMLNSLVDLSQYPSGKIQVHFKVLAENAAVSSNHIMARWVMTTLNVRQCGGQTEISKHGMLCCRFNSENRIVSLELMFDVMAFMLQLKRSAGALDFPVIPNTVQTCQRPFGLPMVMTLADPPYTIIQVNNLWEKMTGWKAEEVVGKLSCKILQGQQTNRAEVERLLSNVLNKRASFHALTNFSKKGHMFQNYLTLFPLATDSKITHYLGLTSFYKILDSKSQIAGSIPMGMTTESMNNLLMSVQQAGQTQVTPRIMPLKPNIVSSCSSNNTLNSSNSSPSHFNSLSENESGSKNSN